MYQRYYDGYNIPASDALQASNQEVDEYSSEPAILATADWGRREKLFGLETDDLLLLGVLIFLLHENCDDKPMILIIGFLLLSGFIN